MIKLLYINRKPEEDGMLELMLHGGDTVSADNLDDVFGWYEKQVTVKL